MPVYSAFELCHFQSAHALWAATDGVGVSVGDSREEIGTYLTRNPGMSFVCLDEAEQVIGTVLGGHDGRRGLIYHLAVAKDHRGKGIGRALIDRSLAAIKASGIARGILMVKADNAEGAAFWKHAGWQRREDLKMYSRDL